MTKFNVLGIGLISSMFVWIIVTGYIIIAEFTSAQVFYLGVTVMIISAAIILGIWILWRWLIKLHSSSRSDLLRRLGLLISFTWLFIDVIIVVLFLVVMRVGAGSQSVRALIWGGIASIAIVIASLLVSYQKSLK
mgnify:CR=1